MLVIGFALAAHAAVSGLRERGDGVPPISALARCQAGLKHCYSFLRVNGHVCHAVAQEAAQKDCYASEASQGYLGDLISEKTKKTSHSHSW